MVWALCAHPDGKDGVIDGARTRDNQNHNLGLYQLSYDHRFVGGREVCAMPGVLKSKNSAFLALIHAWQAPRTRHDSPPRHPAI